MSDNVLKAPAIQQENDSHLGSFIIDVKQQFSITTYIRLTQYVLLGDKFFHRNAEK